MGVWFHLYTNVTTKIKIPGGLASSVSKQQEHTCLQVCFSASVRSEPMWALSDWGDVTSLWSTDATCQFNAGVPFLSVAYTFWEAPLEISFFSLRCCHTGSYPYVLKLSLREKRLMHKQGFHVNLLNLKDKRRMRHFFRDLSLIFGVTSILLLCVYSVGMLLDKGINDFISTKCHILASSQFLSPQTRQ